MSKEEVVAGKCYVLFGVLAFLLNFFWESWHGAFLYEGYYGVGPGSLKTLEEFVPLISYASLVDMVLLLGIVLGGVLIWRDQWWWVVREHGA